MTSDGPYNDGPKALAAMLVEGIKNVLANQPTIQITDLQHPGLHVVNSVEEVEDFDQGEKIGMVTFVTVEANPKPFLWCYSLPVAVGDVIVLDAECKPVSLPQQ
jgi:hypothetical protein